MRDAPQSPARVLVVDDDRLSRELVRDALGELVQVECCESAEAALHALRREPADLVISDLSMPGLSGLELLEVVRREHPGTEFVLLTADASVESAVGALRMGAADYLQKPIRPQELALVADRILARRRLLEENVRLRDALRTVESCRTLLRCLDADEVYAVALDLLLHTLPHERGIALFRRPAVPLSDGIALRGFSEHNARSLRDLMASDKPVDLEAVREIEVLPGGALPEGFREVGLPLAPTLVVPLRGRDAEGGVLWLFEDGHPFGPEAIEQAKLVAGHAELALDNAERYSRAKERAFVDDVTEVYNVRYLLQATEREMQRADRYEKELSVLFLDLDRFKRVNDEHGHLVGSQTLRRLSQVLQQCIRQVDTLARYGGDEFTILLVDTGLETSLAVAERIRRAVAETLFEGGAKAPIRLTISIGAATYPRHSRTRDGLLEAADQAMYRAKSLGRNCVCSASQLRD